ncbi:hypothetical protein L7F22_059788 [Adiantum nelumboides]|nr:hypothetical protein [Adiantum nelumboides]
MLNQETNQNLFSIYDRITEVIIELQTLCDENQASKAFQDHMLIILFGGMGGSRVGRDDTQEEKASLSKLLVQLPSTWDGSLGDVFVPACWDQLNAMFTTLGMVESSRYRVCQGSQDNMHSPILYPPSLEDNYSGNVVRCECNAIQKATRKLKRDCKECCEKCTVCGISRKQMMCFDYISIEHQLKCLTRSQSICHKFLEMWRNKKRWLDNSCISEDTKIHEFWDGTKCKNFEDFWNPNSHFELPLICPNSECKQAYRAWPTPDNALQARSTKYKILCKSCREEFECDKVLSKGDPRNFALLVHWDGFQSSKATQKNCGVVEVKILNTGKGSEVRALPVIFIPFSCKKIIGSSSKLFHVFLRPLLQELESLFINGIEIHYNYPINSISGLCNSSSSQTFNARAILMMVTGDHPAQCKIGCFKEGGQAFCRRCKAEARQETEGSGRYIYDQNRFQFKYPPNKRNVEESTLAIAKYEKTLFEGERESILKDSGLSGISSLWRLYDLYGFDPHIDLVFDCMHILSLNMFSKYIDGLMKALNNDVSKMVGDATHRMSKWVSSSIRYGRWPRFPSKYHESYKAEENQKFIQWCLPYILCEVKEIPKDFYDLGLLVIEIAHAFYNYTRENGWSLQNINVVRTLLASWRVRTEELLGPNSAPLEHVAGNSSSFMDEEGRPPSYDDIFRPPKGSLRDPNKLYGKELLEKQHKRQHAVLLDNYRMVRSWFHNVSLPDDLRHNKKGKDDIMKIICENHDNILELVWLKRAKYKWYVEDIYKWVVNWKQSQIKYKKSKKLLLREENCSLSKEEETNDVTKLEASTFPMPIIDEKEEQKKDHMETDKFFMDIKGFEGLQQYKDEDDDNLDHDLEISYTELLQNGLSKRVQATKELSPRDETPMLESYEEMVCPRKSGRKRKLSEKMKKYCEVDNAHIKESNASGEVTKRSKEKSNGIEVDVNTLSHEDMETIVLVYSKKKTIMDMYFCLRKMYIGLKKEESSFRSYSKESKSPDSETMIKQAEYAMLEKNWKEVQEQTIFVKEMLSDIRLGKRFFAIS